MMCKVCSRFSELPTVRGYYFQNEKTDIAYQKKCSLQLPGTVRDWAACGSWETDIPGETGWEAGLRALKIPEAQDSCLVR